MELSYEDRLEQRLPRHPNFPCVMRPVAVIATPKPRIARTNGRWYVRSAPFTPGEDVAAFWEYWDLLSAAAKWCTAMNEDQAWLQWAGRANRGN